ncbi:MAG: peptidoglycan editing factor PgeF [Nitrosomonas sp.]|nr:peptidoglycan editing factor PgeF [Nitrosomonas sp.]
MIDCIIPDWPAPEHVKALFTTRRGGVSSNCARGNFATLNLGAHVNDLPVDVEKNRARLQKYLPGAPKWLDQVHGTRYVWMEHAAEPPAKEKGDAALSRQRNTVCAIMVADCLPVFLCDTAGSVVGVVHAGWRGLAAGIIEQSVAALQVNRGKLMAWLGPAIGPDHFEVGKDVRAAFVTQDPGAASAFAEKTSPSTQTERKWSADIFQLARRRLENAGVTQIFGGGICTYSDPARFFSYRRDTATGRMAALIWLDKNT